MDDLPVKDLEALHKRLWRWLRAIESDETADTVSLSEVDQVLSALSEMIGVHQALADAMSADVRQWVKLREGDSDDETLIEAVSAFAARLDALIDEENWDSEADYSERQLARRQRREAMRGGLFDFGLLDMPGRLVALPDRGVVSKARLKRLAESKKSK